MRILFLCYSLEIGGIQTYIYRFAKWLRKRYPKHTINLLCKSGTYGSYENDYRDAEIVLHSMEMGYFRPWKFVSLYKYIKTNNYKIICDFTGDFAAWPILIAYTAGVKKRIVFYRHARDTYNPKKYKIIYQKCLNFLVRTFSTDILSNSIDAFENYYSNQKTMFDNRFKIIRNGIPTPPILTQIQKIQLRQSLGIKQNCKLILHVGSCNSKKNHRIILRIAKYAQINKDNVCFCFVGPGVIQKYGKMANYLGLNNIKFLGERHDVFQILQITDLFIFPSLGSEGQPNALLEAMVSGIPFIASDTAPIRESLPYDWGRRWLFPPDNVELGYTLLKDHLVNKYKKDKKFIELVEWCKNKYNENKRFNEFLKCITLQLHL